jgi:phosphoglycerol transferase
VYCLKVTQLVLPAGDHRVPALAHLTRTYNTDAPHSNENRDSTLGTVGAVGFAVLLGRLLLVRGGPTLLSGLATLNASALLLGASGGLGGLFNFLAFAQVRCYNRVCVFIAFWSLLAVGVLIDRWVRRAGVPLARPGWQAGRLPYDRQAVVALVLAVFGLWDVTTTRQAPRHSELQTHHAAWVEFGRRMEDALPAGGMVFQLPAASYPEAGPVHRMPDYAHLACHAYTRTLRLSYGTNRNRRWDEWHQHVAGLRPAEMVRALCLAGFDGVYVDRRGYRDEGESVVSKLREQLGPEAVVSESGEQLLFRLDLARARLRAAIPPAEWDRERDRLLNRPCVQCQDGFSPWPPHSPEPRRVMHRAKVRLINPSGEPRRAMLRMSWQRHGRTTVHVHGEALGVDVRLDPPAEYGPVAFDLVLPPGEHLLHFDATPKPLGLARMYCAWTTTEVRLEVAD